MLGSIVNNIYSIRRVSPVVRRASYREIESQLDQWYIGLPETLRFETTSRRLVPPPHILFLHIRYWGAVLLLNRAFIPNWKGVAPTSRNTAEFKAFDLAQGAATHLSAIANVYRETFSMKRGPPFLTSYILNAAVMHILTLTLRPSNVQASLGLQQCMAALKDMEVVWPSASRAWELLNGVKMGSDDLPPQINFLDRQKRPADAAFGQEKSSDYLQREAFKSSAPEPTTREENAGVQELGTRIMAHMLGLNIPGIEASTSYYPGYEWWPRHHETTPPESHQSSSVVDYGPRGDLGSATNTNPEAVGPRGTEWNQIPISNPHYPYVYDRYGLLLNILNPEDGGRRRTVRMPRLILNMEQASTSEMPSSPGTSPVSDLSDSMTVEDSIYRDHEPHPNCPDSLACLPNTEGRPQHTLPVILRCAILGSPRQRLTIREIYAAMENKYAYYRTAGPTWKQSVRHHLSLNRLFERQPRPVTDPGFGSYWTVNLSAPPGTKRPRKRGRQNKEGPPLPPKKKGRPRKSPLVDDQLYSLLDAEEYKHNLLGRPGTSTSQLILDDWAGRSDEYGVRPDYEEESEEECESEEELIHPMDRRTSLASAGLSAYQPSRSSAQSFSLPPFSTLRNADSIIDSLHAEIATLRRQSADAVSLSLRLSEQLVQAQTETSRTRATLETVEELLEQESKRRRDIEKAIDNEEQRRRKAEEALNLILARSPNTDLCLLK
ncbi:hypothetical protein DXG01_009731 [Tephrocybe rancida]|nr:hypothetical protein DXG01_009731 [Tephrocybe rancida]